jgi:hypothetical protein
LLICFGFFPIIFFGSIATAVVLGVLYGILNTFQPLPEDVFRYGTDQSFTMITCFLFLISIWVLGFLL